MQKTLRPERAAQSKCLRVSALQALDILLRDADLGLRSPTRFSPGFHLTGLRPLAKVSCQIHAHASIPCRHSNENSPELKREVLQHTLDVTTRSGNAFLILGTTGNSIPHGSRVFGVEVFAVIGGFRVSGSRGISMFHGFRISGSGKTSVFYGFPISGSRPCSMFWSFRV